MNKHDYSWVESKYLVLKRKMYISNFWFVALNILAFVIAAVTIILNLWAFKYNTVDASKPYFIALSIMSGFIAFITSMISLFTFKQTANNASKKLEKIAKEEKAYESKTGKYKETKEARKIYIKKLTEIYNG